MLSLSREKQALFDVRLSFRTDAGHEKFANTLRNSFQWLDNKNVVRLDRQTAMFSVMLRDYHAQTVDAKIEDNQMTTRIGRRIAASVLLTTAICLANPIANAQSLKTGGTKSSATGDRTIGPGEPEFPPRSIRVHGGTMYVQGSQAADGIIVTSCVIRFVSTITGEVIEDIDLSGVADIKTAVDIVVYGLAGDDFIFVHALTMPVTVFGGLGNDTIDCSGGSTTAFGQDGDDLIIGSRENDVLSGDAGNDTLVGKNGSDIIDGGDGNDTLVGSSRDIENGVIVITSDGAVDYLKGGNDSDTFVLSAALDTSDIVLDFTKSEDVFE